jgi:CO/xanthine dehydrogenase Mo-binding subunit
LNQFALGQSVRRIEAPRLVTGHGRFTDVVSAPGEAGAIGAPAAAINALLDAMQPLGIRHVDMPATPLKLWRLIRDARRKERTA